MAENGKLIVLEAVDDTALALLSGQLCRWLRECGLPVEETREPTYGPAGAQILLSRQGRVHFDAVSLALLYLADRLDHVQREDGIDNSLAAGRHVICNHYGLAAGSQLWGQVEYDWLCRIDALCRVPDLTLFVDLPADAPLQSQLRAGYLAAIQCLKDTGQNMRVVDGVFNGLVAAEDVLAQMSLACKQQIAGLLALEPPACG